MKIKKYNDFIFENSVEDLEKEWHSIGEYVEYLLKDNNEDIKAIVNNFIKESDADIRIANAVNLLKDYDKQSLVDQINDCINGVEKNADIIANTDLQELMESNGGRNIFNSFLKSISAFGLKDTKPNYDKSPNEYIIYFEYQNLSTDKVKSIFARFKSLNDFINLIDYKFNECTLYFGIKYLNGDLFLDYGVKSEDQTNTMGSFKLTQSILNGLITSTFIALNSFKSELVNITYKELLLLAKIKNELPKFDPGYHDTQLKPQLNNGVLLFGYHGLGKWNNGVMDQSDFEIFKSKLKEWILKYNWHSRILVNTNSNSFWVNVNIKNK